MPVLTTAGSLEAAPAEHFQAGTGLHKGHSQLITCTRAVQETGEGFIRSIKGYVLMDHKSFLTQSPGFRASADKAQNIYYLTLEKFTNPYPKTHTHKTPQDRKTKSQLQWARHALCAVHPTLHTAQSSQCTPTASSPTQWIRVGVQALELVQRRGQRLRRNSQLLNVDPTQRLDQSPRGTAQGQRHKAWDT